MAREIETLQALDEALSGGSSLRGLRLQGLDLRQREAQLLAHPDCEGLVVLGGRLSPRLERHLREHHALIFPTDPRAPIDPYRATLYTPQELYAGIDDRGYAGTPDSLAYEWARDGTIGHDALVTLLRAVHDDSMVDAFTEVVHGRPVVGVMGGHALRRGTEGYADAAALGHRCAGAGLLVATGGGPGAMEAANLGAWCRDEARLEDALARLAAGATWRESIERWALSGLQVRRADSPEPGAEPRSVGIPTWFYGHEPPNVFADGIAKLFSNAVREDLLLARSNAGVIVLPGAAGTVQEIFQTVTRLYYADAQDEAPLAPLVLVGSAHWSSTVPIWPVLQALGADRPMAGAVHLVDEVDEALSLLDPGAVDLTASPDPALWEDAAGGARGPGAG